MSYRIFILLNGTLMCFILVHSIFRDIQLDNMLPVDLRNRIVGARLQKDGKLPYTYHWQTKEGMRYYDFVNLAVNTTGVNNITASPFLHELLFPICDLQQRTISRIWLSLQYIFLWGMCVLLSGLTTDLRKKWLLLDFTILFTLTEAWKTLIRCGQQYLLIGFLMACVITLLVRNKKYGIVLAGILAAGIVLVRPIAIVIFIPYLPYVKKNLVYLSASAVSLVLYAFFVLISPGERRLYKNYFDSMEINMQNHYTAYLGYDLQVISRVPVPEYTNVEGFHMEDVKRNRLKNPHPFYSENGSFFVVYNKFIQNKMSLKAIQVISVTVLFLLSVIYFIRFWHEPPPVVQAVVFGFILYLVFEIFMPVYRNQYNTVQWFPLVLAGLLIQIQWKTVPFFLLLTGLLLNICNFPWLPMRHTLGELCWLAGLLMLSLKSNTPSEERVL